MSQLIWKPGEFDSSVLRYGTILFIIFIFLFEVWFKHVLLISKQVKNLYKWTSIRWWQMRYLQWMTNTQSEHNSTQDRIMQSQINLLEYLINLSVSVTILLFTVKSKFALPYNRVLRVKGAMFTIAFWSVTLGLLYRGHTRKHEIYSCLWIHTASRRVNKFHRIKMSI